MDVVGLVDGAVIGLHVVGLDDVIVVGLPVEGLDLGFRVVGAALVMGVFFPPPQAQHAVLAVSPA